MKILTICIPTYNRSFYLDECLNSIYLNTYISKVEIIISDNNSTDNTRDIVSKHIKSKVLDIRYIKNKEILPSLNWYSGIILARTPYMMLLSDDDKLEPGFIDYFCSKYIYDAADCILFSSKDLNNKGDTLKIKKQRNNTYDGITFIQKLTSFKIRYRLSSFIFKTKKIQDSAIFNYKWSGSGQFLDGAMIVESSLDGYVMTDSYIASAYRVHSENDSYKPNFLIINNGRDTFIQYIKNTIKNARVVSLLYKWIIYGYIIQLIRFIILGVNSKEGIEYLKKTQIPQNYHKIIIKIIVFIIDYANIININIRRKN